MTDVPQWFAPGRVNLIGEHLDYNGGPVLPIAIDRGTTVKARTRDDDQVRVWTTHGGNLTGGFAVGVAPGDVDGWLSYVAGVFWSIRSIGHTLPGFDLVIDSDVPSGAGLSSSAALECAVAGAVNEICGLGIGPIDMALLAQRAEADFVGVPCGAMDQLASMCGQDGHALFINTAVTPPTVDAVTADWVGDGLELLVIDTKTVRQLADGRYAQRRQECAEAARVLELDALAAAGPDAVLRLGDETLKARTRHVITETARTRGAVRALRARNWTQFGAILTASHESLRADFEVSCMELDIAVEAALTAGALGARMTGGGFGGSVIALIPAGSVKAVTGRVTDAFGHAERAKPDCFVVNPADGMHRVSP